MPKTRLLYLGVIIGVILFLFIGCGGGGPTPNGGTPTPTPAPTALTIHVPGNYATIQAAIDAANDGDTIIVSAGTYRENLIISKRIILQGADPAHPELTVIDAGANGKDGIRIENAAVTIKSFTITNVVDDLTSSGSAIYIFGGGEVTIDGNIIENNKTKHAAINFSGMSGNNDTPLIINNIIRNNEYYASTVNGGSGIYISGGNAQVRNNTISGNKSSFGGGIWVNYGYATIEDNIISGNDATNDGGGINVHQSEVTIKNNTITKNHATYSGGGINLLSSTAKIFGNTISDNTADDTSSKGGGIRAYVEASILDQNGNSWPAEDKSGLNGLYQDNTFFNNQPNDLEFY